MKKILTCFLIFSFLFPTLCLATEQEDVIEHYHNAQVEAKSRFSDIDSVKWAHEAITELATAGIVTGVGDGLFEPNRFVNRGEYIKLIVSVCGLIETDAASAFSDVPQSHWAYPYVSTAKENLLLSMYTQDELGVATSISREDMAAITNAALVAMKLSPEVSAKAIAFYDAAEISDYARQGVNTLTAFGIINGLGNGSFAPKESATRAQACSIIYKVLNLIKEEY